VILIVRRVGDRAVAARLRAEFSASSWQVIDVGASAPGADAALAELAARYGARAALRWQAGRGALELWVAETLGSTDGALESISDRARPARAQVLAWRAAEALRARGLEVEPLAPAPAKPSSAAPPDAAHPTSNDSTDATDATDAGDASEPNEPTAQLGRPRLLVELGPAALASPGGIGTAIGAFANATWSLSQTLSVSGLAFLPLKSPTVVGNEGNAEISPSLLGLALDASWLRLRELELSSGLGGGLVSARMQGRAESGYVSASDRQNVAMALVRSALQVAIYGNLRLSTRVFAGLSSPELSVRFAGREAGTWGSPFFGASLSLEATFLHTER